VTGDELLDALSSLRRAVRRGSARPSELSALSGAQLELVRLVRRQPGISVADAAAELRVAANTVSTLVRQLTETSVLVRRVDADDRRIARLDLSPGIRRKVEAWRDRRSDALDGALARLSQRERARIEAALPALTALAGELA
jgi:DNA-binding MarR family transcriptional regulator